MADALYHNARYIRGGTGPVMAAGNVAGEIKGGDLVVLASNKAIRVSSMADAGTLAQNQEAAHDAFLGSALSGKLAGQTANITIQPDGEHLYPCVALASALDVGAFVGIAGTGTGLLVGMADQQVVPVAAANLAIGKLARPAAVGDTQLYVNIAAAVSMPSGGTQAAA